MRTAAAVVAAILVLANPAAIAPAAGSATTQSALIAALRRHVKYVFVIYQENRSFDSYFGTFPGADGIYSDIPRQPPGFSEPLLDVDGSQTAIEPFRIGPSLYAGDTDDVIHSHSSILNKMDIVDGVPQMDRFALVEERGHTRTGSPSLEAKQMGELAMAHEDCDTIPFLWQYASRFVLFDHIFQVITGPSTPGNLAIVGAQTGITQWLLHPDEAPPGNGDRGAGVPVVNDSDPFWGSIQDRSPLGDRVPIDPQDVGEYGIQRNLTYATIPLTLSGRALAQIVRTDRDPKGDLRDLTGDMGAIRAQNHPQVPWGWYQEGYDREPTDGPDPLDAQGRHASYLTHHNGPQYFGYVSNNPQMRKNMHGLDDFFAALEHRTLPRGGGLFYVKGGFQNIFKMKPADPDPAVQRNFQGDDDHPGYSDAAISESMIARIVNRIAASPYWKQSAVIITWDDSEGDYDHVRPPLRIAAGGEAWLSDGPRVPLIVISPYAKSHAIVHAFGDQGSVVKFADVLFGLIPLADLPDERRAARLGFERFGAQNMGPSDAPDNGLSALLEAFDPKRLSGADAPLPAESAHVPDATIAENAVPGGCRSLGIVPTDVALHLKDGPPADFNPRPETDPTK